ncbi:MAG: hypothetical protein ABFC12_01610 [Methanobacterium sp.]
MSEDNKSEDNNPTRYNPKKNSKSEGEIMKMKITDGMGNDEEINIESDVLTGKELLEKLDINLLQR